MEDIDGGLHPAVDAQSLDEDEDEDSVCVTIVRKIFTQELIFMEDRFSM